MREEEEVPPPRKIRRRRKNIDLTKAFGFPFGDKEWPVKLLVHGLLILIPILGSIIIMGWQRQAVAGIKAGEKGLPAIDIGKSISEGIAPFVAILNAVIPMTIFSFATICVSVGSLVGGILLAEEMNEGIFVVFGVLIALVSYGGIIIAAIIMMIIMPELRRRGFHGEMFPLLSPGKSIAVWKAQPIGYLVLCVGFLLTSLLGGLGVYLCYVGMLITLPWAHGANASLLAQFDMLLEDDPAPDGHDETAAAVSDTSRTPEDTQGHADTEVTDPKGMSALETLDIESSADLSALETLDIESPGDLSDSTAEQSTEDATPKS